MTPPVAAPAGEGLASPSASRRDEEGGTSAALHVEQDKKLKIKEKVCPLLHPAAQAQLCSRDPAAVPLTQSAAASSYGFMQNACAEQPHLSCRTGEHSRGSENVNARSWQRARNGHRSAAECHGHGPHQRQTAFRTTPCCVRTASERFFTPVIPPLQALRASITQLQIEHELLVSRNTMCAPKPS